MEHLSLEIFDREGTGSKYATLPEDTVIHIRRTSQVFGHGSVWSHDFTLNIPANAHIFGSAGDMHGSRLHEQINKRRARLWVEGQPMFLCYLKLADEVDVDEDGNVDFSLESSQKIFDDMIADTNAREVSVGDVVIGVALNRKRVVKMMSPAGTCRLDGLDAYAAKEDNAKLTEAAESTYIVDAPELPGMETTTPYVQRWPKIVKSHGTVYNSTWGSQDIDYTNVQTAYDASHPFCNINICYQMKTNKMGEEVTGRGYTKRLAHDKPTTDGGDDQTRYNNAPNFYLLHFVDRLMKDLGIHIEENQMMDVEDLRRVFMLNYGCHYEELEDLDYATTTHSTPAGKEQRYGQYYMPIVDDGGTKYLLESWDKASMKIQADEDIIGKVLVRDVEVFDGVDETKSLLKVGSLEGKVIEIHSCPTWGTQEELTLRLDKEPEEESHKAYSSYLAYATGDNYPNVDISEIIEAMKAMFGVRLLFDNDYRRVRIVLLRNIFRNKQVQEIQYDISEEYKTENCIRGFRLTYGKGDEDTQYYYKGFNDLFPRASKTWKDTTDKHDYSQWSLNADYTELKQHVSAMNRTCYVTPVNGNAYAVKVDEEEDVLFPTLFEVGTFMDAEDGDCSGESETIKEIQIGATPAVMNDVNGVYASLFNGEMKAPSPDDPEYAQKIATFGRISSTSYDVRMLGSNSRTYNPYVVKGKLDIYISEGFQIRMMDNYGISNTGTPFDDADPGLQFGIMRGSGSDSKVTYFDDPDDSEGNMTWEIVPGSGAIDHPDTCDSYGNMWDYNGDKSGVGSVEGRVSLKLRAEKPNPLPGTTTQTGYSGTVNDWMDAAAAMALVFTTSNSNLLQGKKVATSTMRAAGWTDVTGDYVIGYLIQRSVEVMDGKVVNILWTPIRQDGTVMSPSEFNAYVTKFGGPYVTADVVRLADAAWDKMILDMYTTDERAALLQQLLNIYYADNGATITPVNVDSTSVANSDTSGAYLEITNELLKRRGLADQFYKEYSYWERNARIANFKGRMTLSQLLTIDDTVRVEVGDVTGYMNEMEYDIDMQTGLGDVSMQVMYI